MPVSSALVFQYYQGILRQEPSPATITQLANSANLSVLTTNLLNIANTSVDPILRLYQAAFGRVPDNTGLTNMVNVFSGNAQSTGSLSLLGMSAQFTGSNEFVNLYGANTTNNASNTQFVAALYVNVLNRAMVGSEGQGWIGFLNNGMSRAQILLGFSESPEFRSATRDAVDNFLTSAGALTNTYSGDLFFYGTAPAANIQSLKFGTDILNGNAGYNIFEAGLVNDGTGTLVNSLDNSDRITGGEGANTINIVLASSATPTLLSNIQNINLSNSGTATLDLTNANAVTNINVNNTVNTQTVSGIQNANTQFLVANTGQDVTFNVASAALLGSSDVANLTVKGVSSGATITVSSGYETLTINSVNYSATNTGNAIETDFAGRIILQDLGQTSGGAVSNTLAGSSGPTSNITSNNINATGLSGALTAYLTGGTTFVGGNGNTTLTSGGGVNNLVFGNGTDTLNISALSMVSNATSVVGGSGVDTLALSLVVVDGVDGNFAKISTFDTLSFINNTNTLTIGTNFVNAGFTTITGSASADIVTASNVVLTNLTFAGGAEADVFAFNNTASGTVTVRGVETVTTGGAEGNASQIVNIADTASATVVVNLGAGSDTVNILANNQNLTVNTTGVETINALASSVSGNTVVLGDNATIVTINGGAGALNVNANLVTTASNTYNFGSAADTLTIATLATVSNATSVVGGSGVDTLALSLVVVDGVDGNFAKISTFDTLSFINNTNTLTIGTNFVNAGFTTITGSASNDAVTVANTTLTGLTFNGGAGTDTLLLNTAGGTVTINLVDVVNSTGTADTTLSLAQAGNAVTVLIDLGAGTDSVTNLNTAGATVNLTGAETYLGSLGVDAITLGSGGAITINGGGGTDSVILQVNTANVTVVAGSGAAMSVIGTMAATSDALTIAGAGTYNLTSVETVTVTGAGVSTVNGFLFLTDATSGVTAGDNTLFTYSLSNNDIAGFTMINETAAVTGGSVLLTVNAAENATITFNNSALIAGQTGAAIVSTMDQGYTSITLGGTSSDVIQTNIGGLSAGVSTANSIVVTNFGAEGADSIDLTGGTLTNGLGVNTVLTTSYLNQSGLQNQQTFALNTAFVTGNSTTLANLSASSGPNQSGVIFQFAMGSTTADFATQAGINTAVSYIVGNIGTTTTGSQSAILAVASGASGNTGNALFLFTDDGVSGIDASDLKLIGVVNGTLSNSSFS